MIKLNGLMNHYILWLVGTNMHHECCKQSLCGPFEFPDNERLRNDHILMADSDEVKDLLICVVLTRSGSHLA